MNINSLVVKDNALINASYNLDLVEQRLVLLAIIKIRQKKHKEDPQYLSDVDDQDELMLSVKDYIEVFKVHPTTAYRSLKQACDSLFDKKFKYQRFSKKGVLENVKSRWVQRIAYAENEAYVKVKFSTDVEPLLMNLEKNFTTYELHQIAELGSGYAVRIYELIIAWKTSCQTPIFEISDFRNKLGILESQYSKMSNFKNKVLDKAIEQINEYTDITVEYKQHKQGKTITGFSFIFKYKKLNQEKPKILSTRKSDMFKGFTEKQINFFAKKLAYDDSFSSQYAEPGEGYCDVEKRLAQKLSNIDFVIKNIKVLESHGFKA